MEFRWKGAAPKGGQFFLVKPRRTSVFLPRPISVSAVGENTVSFLIARRGSGTKELTDMRPGDEAELIGPLGNCWLDCIELKKKSRSIALIGGGIGIAPLLVFAHELAEKRIPFNFYAGFRSAAFALETIKPLSLVIVSEDGSVGAKGRVTEFFFPKGYAAVFACGPQPMLKTVADLCIGNSVPCFISMEKHMACGVGACRGCTVETLGGNRSCCADGPIFNAGEVYFD
ncbi:MAG: dihydroorotate dehydrogenase electron transfer subunit, partial [Treponema sp.]|jgi:NAD(P)H-flavin reductase|nr:dihydroorotate dehydrogenase electron transfer subunit [Treponema sp.]